MNRPETLIDPAIEVAVPPEVRNHTRYPSQYFQMMDVGDQIFHVLVARLTYDLRSIDTNGMPRIAAVQHPLATTDQYYGDPLRSSVLMESDFAPFKPRCDVLINHACAQAPDGKAEQRWMAGVRIGDWIKQIVVTGPRRRERGLFGWRLSEIEPARTVPIRYELAWGGRCQWPEQVADDEDPEIEAEDAHNPIGVGFFDAAWAHKTRTDAVAAPQILDETRRFDAAAAARGDYPVAGLGALGRSWQPRLALAGTYDDAWRESRWPRLPKDFDFAYWNCAPADQQIPFPAGGEGVVLAYLHAQERLQLRLPDRHPHMQVRLRAGPILKRPMHLDTLIVDLQAFELTCVHRATVSAAADVRVLELRQEKR